MFKLLSILFIIPMATLFAEPEITAKPASEVTSPKTNPLIYDRTVTAEMDVVYKSVFTSLENNGYYVLLESNIGKNLSHFAKRWGKEYNKNKLSSIRSMMFCNGSYANRLSNIDPSMLAICPLRVTLYSKENKTHILFVRPGKVAAVSKAHKLAKELEDDVIRTIEVAITSL